MCILFCELKRECRICKESKPLNSDFYEEILKNNKIFYRRICKECKGKQAKLNYNKNKDHLLEQKKIYYKENKKTISLKRKERYNIDKQNILEKGKNYRKTNPEITLLNNAKKRAQKKDLEFYISRQNVKELISHKNICPLLKIVIKNNDKVKYNSITLDRIDNSLGYIKSNIHLISFIANSSKGDFSFEEYNFRVNRFLLMTENKLKINFGVNDCKYNIKNKEGHCKFAGINFNLTKNYINSIFPIDNICPICLNKFSSELNFLPTLDRFDSKKGYIEGNVSFICFRCNRMKQNLSIKKLEKIRNNWRDILIKRYISHE